MVVVRICLMDYSRPHLMVSHFAVCDYAQSIKC